MRIFLSLLILNLSTTLMAQVNSFDELYKRWYRIHSVMLDGSRDLETDYYYSTDNTWIITPETIWRQYKRQHRTPENTQTYQYTDNKLMIASNLHYDVVHISRDTLILVETRHQNLDFDKRVVHYLVNAQMIDSINKPTHATGNILKASRLMGPQLKFDIVDTLIKENNTDYLRYAVYKISGVLKLRPKTNETTVEYIDVDIKDLNHREHILEWITKTFQEAYSSNDYMGFEHYEEIHIPFKVEQSNERHWGYYYGKRLQRFNQSSLIYFESIEDPHAKSRLPYKTINSDASAYYFGVAMQHVEKKRYKRSIKPFEQAFHYDFRNIDAVYNLLYIYTQLKDKENMCKYISILKELEQKQGTVLYEKHCQ